MLPSVLVLDLDFTIARFEGGYDAIYDAVAPFGVERNVAREILEDTLQTQVGFNFLRYAQALSNAVPNADVKEIVRTLDLLLDRVFRAYPEVEEIFEKFRRESIPIRIVTTGNRSFHKRKVFAIGFPLDEALFTDITVGKVGAIQEILETFDYSEKPIWYVDDRREELSRIAEDPRIDSTRIRFFEMVRPDCPNISPRPDPRFTRIASLRELPN